MMEQLLMDFMMPKEESTSSLEERPARMSASLEKELASLKANAPHWPLITLDWLTTHAQDGWSGKTCQVSYRRAMDATSQPSSQASPDGTYPCHQADGRTAESSRIIGGGMDSHIECLTLNIREWPDFQGQFPSGDEGCFWWDTVASLTEVLWTGPIPLRYYLTEKACTGILRRAERRGKKLPEILLKALTEQAEKMAFLEKTQRQDRQRRECDMETRRTDIEEEMNQNARLMGFMDIREMVRVELARKADRGTRAV